MKRFILLLFTLAIVSGTAYAAEKEVKLVYPTDAASIELDNSTPAKRIEPPIREESEQDVVTPLGQIRDVINSLDSIEAATKSIKQEMKTFDLSGIFPLLEKTNKGQEALTANVAELMSVVKAFDGRISAIEKATENIKEAVKKGNEFMANAKDVASTGERAIDKATRLAIFITCAIVAFFFLWKFGATITGFFKTLSACRDAYLLAQAEEIVRKQQASAAAAPTPATESK